MSTCALATTAGLFSLIVFDGTAGKQGPSPSLWPTSSSIRRDAGKLNLLVFAHPFCPCTRATLEELSRALSRVRRPDLLRKSRGGAPSVSVRVLFVRPSGSAWTTAETWDRAASIPYTTAAWDDGGIEAQRFKAQTSGIVLLYDSAGRLLFQGGITGSRGHMGDNYGLPHLLAALDTGQPALAGSLVFGCSLATEATQGAQNR